TGTGLDRLTETYCLGGVAPPPSAPCPPPAGGPPTQDILTISAGGASPVSRTDIFQNVVQLSSNLDMEANALTGGTGTVTSVSIRFSTSTPAVVPEPATGVLFATGLIGLVLASRKRRKT